MDYDKGKVDEMVLALLWLTNTCDGRAWKGHDWDALEEGERLSRELFERHFALKPVGASSTRR
jgi:hypothetical protein